MRLSFDDLGSLEARLHERLRSGQLTLEKYLVEWDELVAFVGWTWPEVMKEIDSRWTKPTKVPSPACQC